MLLWLWLSGIRQGVNDTWKKACLNLHTVTSGLIIQSTPITAMKRTTNSYLHSSWKSKRNNSWNFLLAMWQQKPKTTWGKISITQLKTLSSFPEPGRWDFNLTYLKNLTVFKFLKFLLVLRLKTTSEKERVSSKLWVLKGPVPLCNHRACSVPVTITKSWFAARRSSKQNKEDCIMHPSRKFILDLVQTQNTSTLLPSSYYCTYSIAMYHTHKGHMHILTTNLNQMPCEGKIFVFTSNNKR